MIKKYKIVFSEKNLGGVYTVSQSLKKGLLNNNHKAELLNIRQFENNIIKRIIISMLYVMRNFKKNEIIILMHYEPVFIGFFLKFLGYEKIINVIHTNVVDYYNSANLIKKIIIRFIMWSIKNNCTVFVSKEAELKAKEKFKLNGTTTIYNIYTPIIKEFIKPNHNKLVLGVLARLHQVKNIDLAIRVIAALKLKYPNLELHIYGKGSEEPKLKDYIADLDCESFIFLKGFTSDQQFFFESIDALISFSSLEGFGMTILESINFKTPVLHTDCSSGPRELMSLNSNSMKKTDSFEKTRVGYLIKPLFKQCPYNKILTSWEYDYIEIVDRFIVDLQNKYFDMEYSFERFSEQKIINKWIRLL